MKFIRKNGRIIPLKEKYPTGSEKVNLAIDATQGLVEGVAARAFWHKKEVVKKIAIASVGTDILTSIRRIMETRRQKKGVLDFVKKEAVGYGVGYGGMALGFFGTNALLKYAKNRNVQKIATGKIFNATYKVLN